MPFLIVSSLALLSAATFASAWASACFSACFFALATLQPTGDGADGSPFPGITGDRAEYRAHGRALRRAGDGRTGRRFFGLGFRGIAGRLGVLLSRVRAEPGLVHGPLQTGPFVGLLLLRGLPFRGENDDAQLLLDLLHRHLRFGLNVVPVAWDPAAANPRAMMQTAPASIAIEIKCLGFM